MDNKVKVALVSGIIAIIIFLGLTFTVFSDKTGPVINVDDSVRIVYHEGDNEAELLKGVTAFDEKDGDVSYSVRVDNTLVDGDVIKVKYAAKDSNNNITISGKYRTIEYIAKETEVESESEEETEAEEETTTQVVNDSVGEIDKEEADKTGIPVITLIKNEATIYVGQTFSDMTALSYVKETYDNSGDVSRRIRINGNEGNLTEGDYEVEFTVSDREGNVSKPAILILHVIAGE